jgi:hypothetical protein
MMNWAPEKATRTASTIPSRAEAVPLRLMSELVSSAERRPFDWAARMLAMLEMRAADTLVFLGLAVRLSGREMNKGTTHHCPTV